MSRYVLGGQVEFDMDEIWEYIAKDSLDAADRVLVTFYEAMDALTLDPGAGHTRRDLTALPILFWPVGSYLILYKKGLALIQIVAVVHAARDIPSFLKGRS
ncbi:type II toxin-antitoxin system RelE/ParE family toxin [Granulicella tundricola]|uniref:Plasmid stabilization system n=1 Tax=Granulicella tundricola (strain ATCC BAA-1859 / DSM 23138 / MP5ACTX9) TaxID=1198114 RepID=E8X4I9_GRATM|nr:type II toxin-antitoxin system RelE/ParE family toxin [Granulicella tundricola]ADW69399.1 plasmid stabilization system [Granulicella tundricola MP5ACTX9]